VVLTKCDLTPYLDVDLAAIRHSLAHVMPEPTCIEASAKTGAGIAEWVDWLEAARARLHGKGERHAHTHIHSHSHGHSHPQNGPRTAPHQH
jgi:hydrogenase nickel incorporation protein HypB